MATKEISGLTIDEWLEENKPPPLPQPGDITALMASEKWGCSIATAKRRLDKMAAEGELEKVSRTNEINGNEMTCYRLKE